MPIRMNVIESCRYKEKFPNRKVFYKYDYKEDVIDCYFIEELQCFRDEFRFELIEGKYPEYWDQDDYGWSHFYNRHIFGDMICETEEEEKERLK